MQVLEDQENSKRYGYLTSKRIRPPEAMERTIIAAVGARRDPDFVLCARTDAAAVEGLDAAIDRARRYVAVDAVIYLVTLLRLAMGAIADGLATLAAEGTQAGLVDRMQTRDELYRILDYDTYAEFDGPVADFRGGSTG